MKKDTSSKAFLERLKAEAPEVLEAEVDFDVQVIRVIQTKLAQLKKTSSKNPLPAKRTSAKEHNDKRSPRIAKLNNA